MSGGSKDDFKPLPENFFSLATGETKYFRDFCQASTPWRLENNVLCCNVKFETSMADREAVLAVTDLRGSTVAAVGSLSTERMYAFGFLPFGDDDSKALLKCFAAFPASWIPDWACSPAEATHFFMFPKEKQNKLEPEMLLVGGAKEDVKKMNVEGQLTSLDRLHKTAALNFFASHPKAVFSICKFFASAKCAKGELCTYVHLRSAQ